MSEKPPSNFEADYGEKKPTTGSNFSHNITTFDVSLSYDLNGNIMPLDRNARGAATQGSLAQHEEGRFRPNGSEMIYEYILTDHLGNARITFGDSDTDGDPDILQEDHFYPFGMLMTMTSSPSAAPPNEYLYNGKELQTELGLDWYDYGARMYDASIGKWNGVDPLAELYLSSSPYAYVMNNPLNLIDPTGMSAEGAAAPKAPGTDELSPGEKRRKMRRDKRKYGGGLSDDQKKDQADAIKGTAIANSSLYKGNGSQSWDSGGTLPSGLNPNSNRDGGTGAAFGPNINSESRTNRANNHRDEYFTYLSPGELFERYFNGMNKAATDINQILELSLGQLKSSELGPYPAAKIYNLLDEINMLSSFEIYSYGGIMASFIRVEIILDSDEEILFDSPVYNKGAFIPIPDPYIALPSDFGGTFFDGTTGFNITDAFPSKSHGGPSQFPYKDFLLKDGQQISVRISIYVQQIIPH